MKLKLVYLARFSQSSGECCGYNTEEKDWEVRK